MRFSKLNSIIAKLSLLISVCLVATISINSWQNGALFYDTLKRQLHDSTVAKAKQLSANIDGIFNGFRGQAILLVQTITSSPPDRYKYYSDLFSKTNPDFAAFYLVHDNKSGSLNFLTESNFISANEKRLGKLSTIEASKRLRTAVQETLLSTTISKEKEIIKNISGQTGLPVFIIAVPFSLPGKPNEKMWGAICVWQSSLASVLPKNETSNSMLLDSSGNVISSGTLNNLRETGKPRIPIVLTAINDKSPFGFKGWKDDNGTPWLGAYSRTRDGNTIAVIYTDGSEALNSTIKLVVRSALWTLILVLIGIMLSYITASATSRRVVELSRATQEIAKGNFAIPISSKSNDEIGLLTQSVSHMSGQIVKLMAEQVEKARMERELETATKIQNMFFGQRQFESKDLNFNSFFTPASECGGDWWGHIQINEKKHLICIADATGHGVPAALITAIAYSASTLLATFFSKKDDFNGSMADILLELNKLLCKFGAGKMTMTFYAALIDLEKGVMSVANAGHNFPILVPAKNAPERFSNKTSKFKFGRGQVTLSVPGTPLGLLADAKYEEFKVPIVAGDKVIFFTDGLIECKSPSGAMWGQKNFSKLIEKLRDIPGKEINSKIVEAAFDHFGNTPLADDVTVVTVEIPNQSTIDRKPTNEEKNIVSIDLSTDLDTQKSA